MTILRRPWLIVMALLWTMAVLGQEGVPQAGLRAEMEGHWSEAVSIYRSVLAGHPNRADLWVRIAQIEGKEKHPSQAAEALEHAVALNPTDDALFFELSQAYAEGGNRQGALASVRKALALKPDEPRYLSAGVRLATWNDDYAYALELNRHLLLLNPADAQAQWELARLESFQGELDRSARDYAAYLKRYPHERQALMEYISVQTWRGDYAAAMALLERYRHDFGADQPYRDQKALVLALAKRSKEALAIAEPGLAAHPSDFTLASAKTIALANGRQPEEALQSLKTVEALQPNDPLAKGVRLFVTTPLRSTLEANAGYSHDSDDLSLWYYALEAKLALSPVTFVKVGGRWDGLSAQSGSGLEQLNGDGNSWQRSAWVGLSHRFSPAFALDLNLGGARIENGPTLTTYQVAADIQPADTVALRLTRSYGFYVISPRALSEDIRQTINRLDLHTDLGFLYHLDAEASFDTFSDGNRLWNIALAPRRQVLRTGHFNLDVGVRGWWFGFKEDPGHGYYAPNHYQRYALTLFGYWKIDDNDGIGVVLAPGALKDNTMGHFRFGIDASLEGTFGIYRNWMLRVSLSHVDNNRVASGAYRGTSATAALVRRF